VFGGRTYTIVRARLSAHIDLVMPPGLAVVDNVMLGVCGDGRALRIDALAANDAPVSINDLLEALQAG
jgi:methionyl-tRNA formyltransferase